MQNKIILSLLLTLVFGSLQMIEARTARQIKIQVNQEKKIADSDITLKFVSVLEDSRCPVDARCIQAGNAKLQINLRKSNGERQIFEINTNLKPQAVTFEGYEIKLTNLDPKLKTNIRLNRDDYIATFTVNRSTKR